MALTSSSVVKTHLGITGSAQDAQIAQLITQVDAVILNALNRQIEQATYTEFYSGNGTPILALNQYPVSSITSLYQDDAGYFGFGTDAFASAKLLVAGTDYALMRDSAALGSTAGMVRRLTGVWPEPSIRAAKQLSELPYGMSGNIRCEYVAGYAAVPADLQLLATQVVARIMSEAAMGGGLLSAAYEDASFTRMSAAEASKMIGSSESILRRYKRTVI